MPYLVTITSYRMNWNEVSMALVRNLLYVAEDVYF